jgi:hypothetical protein
MAPERNPQDEEREIGRSTDEDIMDTVSDDEEFDDEDMDEGEDEGIEGQ